MANCIDCTKHEVIRDPDPDDWFCDDDVAVVCTLTSNPKQDQSSRYAADHSMFRAITVACRPYNKRMECERPAWCPIAATPSPPPQQGAEAQENK